MPIIKREKERFIKFALVGFGGTVIDFCVFNLLLSFQINSIFAGSVSFFVAVLNNYFWNRNWTYPESKIAPIATQLIKFSSVSIAGLVIRNILYKLIEQPIIRFVEGYISENNPFSVEVFGQNISLAIVIIVILIWNFSINRLWTYKNIS